MRRRPDRATRSVSRLRRGGLQTVAVAAIALALAALPAVAATTGGIAAPAAAPATAATAATATPVLGVGGRNAQLYGKFGDQPYQSFGGHLLGAPAVFSDGREVYYIVRGSDNNLYVRSNHAGFAKLSTTTLDCAEAPGAAFDPSSGFFAVACLDRNKALFYAMSTLPGGAELPQTGGFTRLGGQFTSAPGVFFTSADAAQFLGVGTVFDKATGNNTYLFNSAGQHVHVNQACSAAPEEVVQSGNEFFACRDGRSGGVRFSVQVGGVTQSGVRSSGNIGRPGLAVSPNGASALVYVTGSNRAIYRAELTIAGLGQGMLVGGSSFSGPGATEFIPPA